MRPETALSPTPPVVEADAICFDYGRRRALTEVSFALTSGLCALLGPNGAGKSTLISVLSGLVKPSSGRLLVDGTSLDSARGRSLWRARIGFLPQNPHWSAPMTSRAFLEYFGQLRGLARPAARSRAEECLALVGLDDCAGRSLDQLSGGEVRRLFIAQSLVHDPQLLVLDEPTAGLDPLARIELRELIDNMRDGRIIVMATHLLEDVIHLAAMVKVLDQGRLVWQGSAAELGAITSQAGQGSSRLGSPEELGFAELFADHRAENG